MWQLSCDSCSRTYDPQVPRWRCDCGHYLNISGITAPRPSQIDPQESGFWRFNLALPFITDPVSIGEAITPLTYAQYSGRHYHFKLDYLLPTGSYKDRGVAVMVSQLNQWGLNFVVEDSSGNAGSAVAAYCSKAGIACDVYIPSYTSSGKAAQIALYGANLVKVSGTREATKQAAIEAGTKTFYASHNWSPFFEHGVKTYVYEVWEQLGYDLPDVIVAPCGNGSLITSAYLAIQELKEAGLTTKSPRIVAVQTENCAPLALGWQRGLDDMVEISKKETIAEGISSADPLKGKEIIQAVRATNGCFVTVSDDEVWQSLKEMARLGMFIEPTSATAPAAIKKLHQSNWFQPDDVVVVEMTGIGLKATDKILKLVEADK